jgi:hypothetical protein
MVLFLEAAHVGLPLDEGDSHPLCRPPYSLRLGAGLGAQLVVEMGDNHSITQPPKAVQQAQAVWPSGDRCDDRAIADQLALVL